MCIGSNAVTPPFLRPAFCLLATAVSGAGVSSTSDDENEPNRLGGYGGAGEGNAGEGGALGGAAVVPPGARSHSSGLARLRSNKKIHITFT